MSDQCTGIQNDLLELQWSRQLQERVGRVLRHLQTCEECRNAAWEYEALRAAVAPVETAEPRGGWERFEQRLVAGIGRRQKFRWFTAIAAGLLIALTAANAWLLIETRYAQNGPDAKIASITPQVPADMSKASVVKAFRTVSEVFEGRANWVMLSDQASDLGLIGDRQSGTDLLVLRLLVTRGKTAVSQVHIAVIPGATVRVTVPSATGTQLQYVITTDAKNLQNVGVSMAVEDSAAHSADAGLGSMVTSLNMMYGKSTPAGRITTREGTFDLSMTLERGSDAGV